jgi:hypothetical protein
MLTELLGFDWAKSFETLDPEALLIYVIDMYVKNGGPPRGQATFAFDDRCPVCRRERGEYVIHFPDGDVVVYSDGAEDD